MTQQTNLQIFPASKSGPTMMIEKLLELSNQADFSLSDQDYDRLHQAFFNIESSMLKRQRLVRLYPNWETAKKEERV